MTTIHRTDKTGINTFTRIDNRIIDDKRLSFGARGILAYLLSKPDNWRVLSQSLYNKSPAGRKAIDSMFKELIKYAYVTRYRIQDENGQWGWGTKVYENPAENPDYDPATGEVCTTKPKAIKKPKAQKGAIGNDDFAKPKARKPTIGKTDNRFLGDILTTESLTTESLTKKEEEEARSASVEFFQNSPAGANASATLSKNSNNNLSENEKSAIALLREYNVFETPAMEIIQAQQTTDLDELKDRVERHINAAGGEIALAVWRLKQMIDPPVAALDVDFSKMTCLELWSYQTKIPAGKARAALKKWAAGWDTREFDATLMAEAICQADEKSKKFDCAEINRIYCQFDEFSWRADKISFSYTSLGDEVIKVDYIQHPDTDEKIQLETLPEIAKRKFFRVAVKHLAAKQNKKG